MTLYVADVEKFREDITPVESNKKNLAGIDWYITAQMADHYMTLNLNASHPSASEWHCKVSVVLRELKFGDSSSKNDVVIFTEKSPERSYRQWFDWQVIFSVRLLKAFVNDILRNRIILGRVTLRQGMDCVL